MVRFGSILVQKNSESEKRNIKYLIRDIYLSYHFVAPSLLKNSALHFDEHFELFFCGKSNQICQCSAEQLQKMVFKLSTNANY